MDITELDENTLNAIKSFEKYNPNYEIKIFNEKMCIDYIKTHYGSKELHIFELLIPYAFKADFFRYLLLYKEGGYYSDIKNVCLESFDRLFPSEMEWFSCIEKNTEKPRMQNGFFACIPKHPFLKKAIDKVMDNVAIRFMGKDPTEITGPAMFYECCSLYSPKCYYGIFDFYLNRYYINEKEIVIWKFFYENNMDENRYERKIWNKGENNYRKIWKHKKIYPKTNNIVIENE